MFLVNFLNRSETDAFQPLFECIYAFELLIITLSILFAFPLAFAVVSTNSYHRNIRLRLTVLIFHAVICSTFRVVVLMHQHFGPIEYVEPVYLIIASIYREAFKVYCVSFIIALACDRWVATRVWSWWVVEVEKRYRRLFISHTPSPVELTRECVKLRDVGIVSRAPVRESDAIDHNRISSVGDRSAVAVNHAFSCGGNRSDHRPRLLSLLWHHSGSWSDRMFLVSSIEVQHGTTIQCFYAVLKYNRREIEILKRGAKIESYSVSRSYQYKENVAIMEMLSHIAAPTAVCFVPMLACYKFWSKYPAGAGLDLARLIAIALFDVWLAAIVKVAPQEANTYFAMLARDLEKMRKLSRMITRS